MLPRQQCAYLWIRRPTLRPSPRYRLNPAPYAPWSLQGLHESDHAGRGAGFPFAPCALGASGSLRYRPAAGGSVGYTAMSAANPPYIEFVARKDVGVEWTLSLQISRDNSVQAVYWFPSSSLGTRLGSSSFPEPIPPLEFGIAQEPMRSTERRLVRREAGASRPGFPSWSLGTSRQLVNDINMVIPADSSVNRIRWSVSAMGQSNGHMLWMKCRAGDPAIEAESQA